MFFCIVCVFVGPNVADFAFSAILGRAVGGAGLGPVWDRFWDRFLACWGTDCDVFWYGSVPNQASGGLRDWFGTGLVERCAPQFSNDSGRCFTLMKHLNDVIFVFFSTYFRNFFTYVLSFS